jgi:hypothetical protein
MHGQIIAFYRHQGTDDKGRTLKQLWEFSNEQIEKSHDFIQWLFPLPEPSNHNLNAPILDNDTIDIFKRDRVLRKNLARSYVYFINFLGFRIKVENGQVEIARDELMFEIAKKVWLRPRSHNFLRITRVIRSTKLLGLANCSKALLKAMEELSESFDGCFIHPDTMAFWKDAYYGI